MSVQNSVVEVDFVPGKIAGKQVDAKPKNNSLTKIEIEDSIMLTQIARVLESHSQAIDMDQGVSFPVDELSIIKNIISDRKYLYALSIVVVQ